MVNYMKKKGFLANEFPDFPPKRRLFAKNKYFIQKRIKDINTYLNTLFTRFPYKIPYTSSIIDLC
jgi:hypothetical protein